MRNKYLVIGICLGSILLVFACTGIGPSNNNPGENTDPVYPSVLSFNLSALAGAKKIVISSSTLNKGTREVGTSTLYVIDALGNFIPINLVDQNGNVWIPQNLLKSGVTSMTLDVTNGTETRTILVHQTSGSMYDISASLRQFGDQSAVQAVIEDNSGICWCETSNIVYKVDLTELTVEPINNGIYNPISTFVPINGKVLTPSTVFKFGTPPIAINAGSIFSTGISGFVGEIFPPSNYNFGVYDLPIYDPSTESFWQLGYTWYSISTVTLGLMKTTLSPLNTLQGQWTDESTNLGGIYGVIVEPNSSLFDTSRRYVLPYVPAVAVLSFDPNVGTPTVSVFSISSAVGDISAHVFLGTNLLIYKNSNGLYSTNYQTNTTTQLYPSSSIITWSVNGQNILVTAYIDSVNTSTMKINPDGTIVDATQTDITPQQLITF